MNFATTKDYDDILKIFRKHKKWFPHVRPDYIETMIKDDKCILDGGVIITFHKLKRRQKIGNIQMVPGQYKLHQIVKVDEDANTKEIMQKFFDYCDGDVYLTVKSDNDRAKAFYNKMNMEYVGDSHSRNGKHIYNIFRKIKQKKSLDKFM
jgi:hypothetical protein